MLSKMYQYKFYLDANHYVTFDGRAGELHPHTWEISVVIELVGDNVIPFYKIENMIKDLLEKYQNTKMNDVEPFTEVNPTLENIGDYFTEMISEAVTEKGWELRNFTISETPSRSYITIY